MQNELYHYGVKGMRCGVRRTKHQLSLEKKARLQMKEALASGRFKKAVNRESQMRHLIGKGYIPGRSYMFGDLEPFKSWSINTPVLEEQFRILKLAIGYREKWLMLEGLSAFISTI